MKNTYYLINMYLYPLITDYVIKTYQLNSRNKPKNPSKQVNLFYLHSVDEILKIAGKFEALTDILN